MADSRNDPSSLSPTGHVLPKTDPVDVNAMTPPSWPAGAPNQAPWHPQPGYGQPEAKPAPQQYGEQPSYPSAQQPAWGTPQSGSPAQNQYTQSMNVNVNVNTAAPTLVMAPIEGPSLIVRAMWFVCIGWWLSALTIVVGYLLVPTIIGIPLAFMLFNKLPQITTMKARTRNWALETRNGVAALTTRHTEQLNWAVRGLYFVVIGFWLGAIWLSLAWAIGFLVITIPITLWMYDRAPAVLTLHRH